MSAAKVIAEAKKWNGYLEKGSNANLESLTANAGDGNYTIFAKWYKDYFGDNLQAQPWCAMFCCVCMRIALGKMIITPFAYTPSGVAYFKKKGWWHTSNPQAGDFIFFKNSSRVCHVGLVVSASGGKVYTIEGNTSSTAGMDRNGGCVRLKSYAPDYSRIAGYGRPPYEEEEEMTQAQFNQYAKNYEKQKAAETPGEWSEDVRTWAEENGLITGDDSGNKQYKGFCTREALVTILYRFYQLIVKLIKK